MLYKKYKSRGLEILGFPCNNFNNQEPGTNKEILKFARAQGATFRILGKLECENGKKTHPLYKFLRAAIPTDKNGPALEWNFVKFLADKDGKPVHRWAPGNMPLTMEPEVLKFLPKSSKTKAKASPKKPVESENEGAAEGDESDANNRRRYLHSREENEEDGAT